MPEVTWTVSGATIVVVLGWVTTGGFQTFRLGGIVAGARSELAQLRRELDDLRSSHASSVKEREQYQGAASAATQLVREQLVGAIQEVAKSYATKEELRSLETRMDKGMDRVVDRLEQLSNRLETIGDAIIKSLSIRSPGKGN